MLNAYLPSHSFSFCVDKQTKNIDKQGCSVQANGLALDQDKEPLVFKKNDFFDPCCTGI